MPRHVAISLVRATLNEISETLREDERARLRQGESEVKRSVHLDFCRKPADAHAGASHAGSSTREADRFFCLPFESVVDALVHFGTLDPSEAPDPGMWVIPGLTLGADFSGLRIKDMDDIDHLSSLLVRTPIEKLHIDLSLIESNNQNALWAHLRGSLTRAQVQATEESRPRYLQELTVSIPRLANTDTLAGILQDPQCDLRSFHLIGECGVEARAQLLAAVEARQGTAHPLNVTINGQPLDRATQ